MRIFHALKKVLTSIDMFCSSEMLRYESNTQFKTITGGIITISIIVMVMIGFASMIIDTLKGTAITSSLNVRKSNDPTYYELKADPEKMFMFGVQLQPLDVSFLVDLANGPRYFDISMIMYDVRTGIITNTKQVPLVGCTDQHWRALPEVVAKKDAYQYQKWLCPQIGQVIPIQGSYTSYQLYETSIFVRPCTNNSLMSRPCMPQTAIDQLMGNKTNFYLAFQYINPVINPSQPNHMSYYLQGNDYVIFSATQGSEAWFFFSDYQITTDSSIFPFADKTTQTGAIVEYKAINHPYTVDGYAGYANLYLAKSSNSLKYTRSVQKISAVFSYIGGLIGALTALLFLLKTYTATSLEIGMAIDLFHQSINGEGSQKLIKQGTNLSFKKEKQVKEELTFNILSFFSLQLYDLLSYFKLGGCLKKAQVLKQFKGEMLQQLDVKKLLKRLISLQNCIGYLFQKHQLQGLKYHKKLDLTKARFLRQQLVPAQIDEDQLPPENNQQDQSHKLDPVSQHLQEPFQKGSQKNRIMPMNSPSQNTFSKAIARFDGALKDQVDQGSAQSCISANNQQGEAVNAFRTKVKIDSQKMVACQTIVNLQQLQKQAQNDPFCQKIWDNVDDSIKKYLETLELQQEEASMSKNMAENIRQDIQIVRTQQVEEILEKKEFASNSKIGSRKNKKKHLTVPSNNNV